jgi:transposase
VQQLLITEIGKCYPDESVIMVIDDTGWHKSKTFALLDNLQLHFLPPYSPELNPQEHIWEELRERYLHNRVFKGLNALEEYLAMALKTLQCNSNLSSYIASWL